MISIKITRVVIKNFKSFLGTVVFDLPDMYGFYMLSGENNQEIKLGSNGAGKSTIWDAIFWCFYGTSLKGLKGPELLNRTLDQRSDTYTVSVEFYDNTVITRSWNPNKIILENTVTKEKKEILNRDIEDLIRLSPSQFTNSVLIGQGSPLFFDMSSSEKSELFHNILDLDVWVRSSDRSKNIETDLLRQIDSVKKEIIKNEGALESIPHDSDLDSNIGAWYDGRKKEVSLKNDEILCIDKEIEETSVLYNSFESIFTEIPSIKKSIDELKEKKSTYVNEIKTNDRDCTKYLSDIEAVKRDIIFYEKTPECPTCKQVIGFETKDKNTTFFKNKILNIKKDITALESVTSRHKENIIKLEESINEKERVLKGHEQNKELYYSLKSKIDNLEYKKTHLVSSVKSIMDKINPHIEIKEKYNKSRDLYLKTIKDLVKKIEDLEQETEYYSFWKDNFKKIRLFVISTILDQLNFDINSAMSSVGLIGWEAFVTTETLTKGGELRQNFYVDIYSPVIKKKVPFETWSGGEAQRLRLASAIGLSSLIQRLKGVFFDLEIYDEPMTYLSEIGISDFLTLFKDRSTMLKKSIFLVDHQTHEFGGFNGLYKISRNKNMSYIKKINNEGE